MQVVKLTANWSNHKNLIGWSALIIAVLIWALFALSIRMISLSNVGSFDVALVRFSIPAILLIPFIKGRLKHIASAPIAGLILVSVGGGLPFFLISALGGHYAPASYVGSLIAGTTPISAAIVSYVLFRKKITIKKSLGLSVILSGVFILVLSLGEITLTVLTGIGILLCASLCWGSYSVGIKRLNLDPLSCVMIVTYPSIVFLALLIGTNTVDSKIFDYPLDELMPFIVMQGVSVGFFSTLFYSQAVRNLGVSRCVTFGSLAPVFATFLAIPMLNEIPTNITIFGVLIISFGVVLSNRIN
ncbi:DMT family transporter [Paraglaciecola marina]|uniref:DMT family transporter n=1 Tax=Paraglaciecola marina TaxID=2500157 RepID=UPI00105F2AD0|nr:DMT family transporter [Paraglaciecola marina]